MTDIIKISEFPELTVPDASDYVPIVDDSLVIPSPSIANKRITWSNIQATLESYFNGLYSVLGHTHSYIASALTSAHILVGNASNVAADVAMSGDATMANTGAVTISKVNGNAPGVSGVAHKFVSSIDSSARGTLTQPDYSDLTGVPSNLVRTMIISNFFR